MGNIPTVPVEELRQKYPEIYGKDTTDIPTESFSQPSSELRQNEAPRKNFKNTKSVLYENNPKK